MTIEERAKKIADSLAQEYGSETFVSDGYGYYDDLIREVSKALQEVQDEVLEGCARLAVTYGVLSSSVEKCSAGEALALKFRSLKSQGDRR